MREYDGVINVDYDWNTYHIYVMYSTDKEDKGIYVGMTEDYNERAYRHSVNRKNTKRYGKVELYIWMNSVIQSGEKILFRIIEGPYTQEKAIEREIQLIKEYKEKGFELKNKAEGGRGMKGCIPWNKGMKMPEGHCKKLSISHMGQKSWMKGKKHTPESIELIKKNNDERKEKGWRNPRKKKIYQYSVDGKLIAEFDSANEVIKTVKGSKSNIHSLCNGSRSNPGYGFFWSYEKSNKINQN